MGDENDGFFESRRQFAKLALQLGTRHGVKSAEGLIHQQYRGIGGKGAGDSDPLALTA